MNERLREASHVHARLLKCGLDVESSRTFWSRFSGAEPICAHRAFDEYWFGARSFSRTKVLLAEMKARYCAFPAAFEALRRWQDVSPDTQLLVCHWHVQLADPMYRAFTGEKLVERRASSRPDITRELVVEWVKGRVGKRWNSPTCVLYASKLLSAAHSAGLIASKRDPRVLTTPQSPGRCAGVSHVSFKRRAFQRDAFRQPLCQIRGVGSFPDGISLTAYAWDGV